MGPDEVCQNEEQGKVSKKGLLAQLEEVVCADIYLRLAMRREKKRLIFQKFKTILIFIKIQI